MGFVSLVIWYLFFLGVVQTTQSIDVEYDFEVATVPTEITESSGTLLDISTVEYKQGTKSLKWTWIAGGSLTWDLTSKSITDNDVRNGGVKIWIKSEISFPGKCLSFCFHRMKYVKPSASCSPLPASPAVVSCFPFSLNFKGWRAAWVGYKEFNGCPSPLSPGTRVIHPASGRTCYDWKITQLVVTASAGVFAPQPLYFDNFRFVANLPLFRATRDATVPPLTDAGGITCTSCSKIYDTISPLTEPDVLARHTRASHWHQIYRWSLVAPSGSLPATVDGVKLASLHLITKRIENWYANENKTYTKLKKRMTGVDYFLFERWKSLRTKINRAERNKGTLAGRGLFSTWSDAADDNKFSWVFQNVLHPLSLSYFIENRIDEFENIACKKAKKGPCTTPAVPPTVPPTAPRCKGTTSANLMNCRKSVAQANTISRTEILRLFDYVHDQGWQPGSALGSIDFQGLGNSGYMHSAFLMRKELEDAHKLDDVIDTMKWHTYFGEVYNTTFEHKGSSADEIRTSMLFRLLTVLSMPENNDNQKKKKIRDMDKLKLWIENALTINEGLADFVKPDFTTYHHKTFYGSAYCASALHASSLVSYLLQGTQFQLTNKVKLNLVKALKVFRIAAVKYSTPSSIGGRFPRYDGAILAQHVSAYAYLAASPPTSLSSDVLAGTTLNTRLGVVEMFLRLYDRAPNTCAGELNRLLCLGTVPRIFYFNTLGSLEIMEKVKALASSSGTTAESSPSGHWYKPFAGLSIHRRDDWAVTVKGSNKYVWDYEQSSTENLYGMYASHGSLLIANNESALGFKNVDEGWDWRKIPGTTAINLDFPSMVNTNYRLYNNKRPKPISVWDTMAGGVSLMGSKMSEEKNGVFGMTYIQPTLYSSVDFRFKKSVFFYDDMIVSLGTSIQCTGCSREVHTALFQDKMISTSTTSSSTPSATTFRCNDAGAANYRKASWGSLTEVKLVDVHGNRYYIPNPDRQGLVFTRNAVQSSMRSKPGRPGTPMSSTGTYCTAWFNHGVAPVAATPKTEYEYLVQIDAEYHSPIPKTVLTRSSIYHVIKRDDDATTVKFFPRASRGTVYGYVVFPPNKRVIFPGASGPLKYIRNQSLIMVEEIPATAGTPGSLFISAAHPDLTFRKESVSPKWCDDGDTSPIEYDDTGRTLEYCSSSTTHRIPVKLRSSSWARLTYLHVNDENKLLTTPKTYVTKTGVNVRFKNLNNGNVAAVKYET